MSDEQAKRDAIVAAAMATVGAWADGPGRRYGLDVLFVVARGDDCHVLSNASFARGREILGMVREGIDGAETETKKHAEGMPAAS